MKESIQIIFSLRFIIVVNYINNITNICGKQNISQRYVHSRPWSLPILLYMRLCGCEHLEIGEVILGYLGDPRCNYKYLYNRETERDLKQKTEVATEARYCAAGFEDKGKVHEPKNTKNVALEVGKSWEILVP